MNIHIEDARQVRDMVASLVTILEALDAAGVREPDAVDIASVLIGAFCEARSAAEQGAA